MEDHIFGTFSTDELKLTHERAAALGLQHHVRTMPRDPLPGEPFTLMVTSGTNFAPVEVMLFYTINGETPGFESETCPFQRVRRRWNTVAWGYVTEWQAEMPGMPDGTVLRYRIAGREAGGGWQWAEWPHPQRVVEQALVHGEAAGLLIRSGEAQDFTKLIDDVKPPQWAQESIIYQIFLDRFARDDDNAWEDLPLDTFHGGTIQGVTRRLDYIASLGVTCIWLTPHFPGPTYHGYDPTDYYEVAPRLGTKEDLKTLVTRAHELGIRVILDFICNHISN